MPEPQADDIVGGSRRDVQIPAVRDASVVTGAVLDERARKLDRWMDR